jgi:hypothetical protein
MSLRRRNKWPIFGPCTNTKNLHSILVYLPFFNTNYINSLCNYSIYLIVPKSISLKESCAIVPTSADFLLFGEVPKSATYFGDVENVVARKALVILPPLAALRIVSGGHSEAKY